MLWSLGPSKYCSISFAQFGSNHLYHCQMYCKCGRDYGSLEGVLTHFWFILWTSARRMWPSKNYITLYHCNHCIALVNINILINCDVLLMYFFSAIVITGALNASPQINLVRLPGPASTGLFQQVGGISLTTKCIMHPFRFRSTKNILLLTIFNCQRNIFEEA